MKQSTFDHSVIRESRERKGLSRDEVLVALHNADLKISGDTLGNWERGESTPGADDLPKLAQVLGISVGDFFNGR